MKIELDTSGIALPKNEAQAVRARMHDAFARLSRRIELLHVTLREAEGHRGGREQLCLIRVELTHRGQIVVREKSAKLSRAIGKAIRRARALVAYEFKRRSREGRRPLVLEHIEVRP